MLVRLRGNAYFDSAACMGVVGVVPEHLAMFGDIKMLKYRLFTHLPNLSGVVAWNDYVVPSSSNLPNTSPIHLFLITRPDLLIRGAFGGVGGGGRGTDGNGASRAQESHRGRRNKEEEWLLRGCDCVACHPQLREPHTLINVKVLAPRIAVYSVGILLVPR